MFKKLWAVFIPLLFLAGCEPDKGRAEKPQAEATKTAQPQAAPETKLAMRDWQQIKQSGYIRALKLDWEELDALPRAGATSQPHFELLQQFAAEHELQIQWVKANDLNQMFDSLTSFKADVIPRHLTITNTRQQDADFTLPLAQDVEVLIGKKGQSKPDVKSPLQVAIPKHTAYLDTIKTHYKHWQVLALDNGLNADDIADALVAGKFQYSLIDRQAVVLLSRYRDDIVSLIELPKTRQFAWAVNKQNPSLLKKLNNFIAAYQVSQSAGQVRKTDLAQMKKQKLPLRMITRNSPETYFLWRGELVGFEYELMREFAKRQKVKLEVVVAESYEQMKQLLEQGHGDLIAAGLSRTEQRKSELKFSFRYKRVDEQLVAHSDSAVINKPEDLKGRTITVRQSSSFWQTAQTLADKYGAKVVAADEEMPTELIIAQVADKAIDLTIADSNLIGIELQFRDNIITPLTLTEGVPYAYAVRDNNPQLLRALNAFIKKEYRGTFYNVVKNKYFGNKKNKRNYRENRVTAGSDLSPYDNMVKTAAQEHQFDWRLITAQMFQESRFNPKAKSAAGALGLMQVLPRTGKEFGYIDLTKPEQSIKAGTDYLNWTRARFSTKLPVQERLLFALAAYNAGFGHVKEAQRLAAKKGWDPNIWFNNVEKAMLLLQYPKYYNKSRFGYCRGSEPVNYVRQIQQRYSSYLSMTQ